LVTVFFKVCDTDAFSLSVPIFGLADETSAIETVPESCSGIAHGYIVGSDGECAFSFTTPVDFNGIPEDPSDDKTDYIGFTLDWTSDESCGEGNFNLKVQADCV